MEKIEDAGEYIPYAKKHLDRDKGDLSQKNVITLKDLWEEPNWCKERDNGRPADVLAYLCMIYDGLAKSPKNASKKISNETWEKAYRESIALLKELFDETNNMDEAKDINGRLALKLGFTIDKIPKLPDFKAAIFWAAGRGDTKLRAPGNKTLRQTIYAEWLPKLGWPESNNALKCGLFPVGLNDGTFRIGRIKADNYIWETKPILTSEQEAIDAVMKRIEIEVGTFIKVRGGSENTERNGTDWRDSRDITAEELMIEFGLRGVQFGNALLQTERQKWLNSAFDALADLANVIGMKRKWIGLGGIALSFAARGQGKAMAHYEPGLKVINLTRDKGAGSLAHEWAHALDNRLAKTMHTAWIYCSQSIGCYQIKTTTTEKNKKIAEVYEKIGLYIANHQSNSDFMNRAYQIARQRGMGSYWYQVEEMFARGFESYIQDALLKKGVYSPWLVHGTLVTDFPEDTIELNCPYPIKSERMKLYREYHQLMKILIEE
jgi:hypothetical protein